MDHACLVLESVVDNVAGLKPGGRASLRSRRCCQRQDLLSSGAMHVAGDRMQDTRGLCFALLHALRSTVHMKHRLHCRVSYWLCIAVVRDSLYLNHHRYLNFTLNLKHHTSSALLPTFPAAPPFAMFCLIFAIALPGLSPCKSRNTSCLGTLVHAR